MPPTVHSRREYMFGAALASFVDTFQAGDQLYVQISPEVPILGRIPREKLGVPDLLGNMEKCFLKNQQVIACEYNDASGVLHVMLMLSTFLDAALRMKGLRLSSPRALDQNFKPLPFFQRSDFELIFQGAYNQKRLLENAGKTDFIFFDITVS